MSNIQNDHSTKLRHIEEVSKNARTTWFGMLGVLVFSVMTLAGLNDRVFFTPGVETALPLVGVSVAIVPFFLSAPILILAIYIYLHLYLLKLWRALGGPPTRRRPHQYRAGYRRHLRRTRDSGHGTCRRRRLDYTGSGPQQSRRANHPGNR